MLYIVDTFPFIFSVLVIGNMYTVSILKITLMTKVKTPQVRWQIPVGLKRNELVVEYTRNMDLISVQIAIFL